MVIIVVRNVVVVIVGVGHHEATKHAKENAQQQQGSNSEGQPNSKTGN